MLTLDIWNTLHFLNGVKSSKYLYFAQHVTSFHEQIHLGQSETKRISCKTYIFTRLLKLKVYYSVSVVPLSLGNM